MTDARCVKAMQKFEEKNILAKNFFIQVKKTKGQKMEHLAYFGIISLTCLIVPAWSNLEHCLF